MPQLDSPRIYYRKAGVNYDIPVHDAEDYEDAVDYLNLGYNSTDSNGNVTVKSRYIPLVQTSHLLASAIRVRKSGTTYAMPREGYIVGVEHTISDDIARGSEVTEELAGLHSMVRNEDSADSYNAKIQCVGKNVKVTAYIRDVEDRFNWREVVNEVPARWPLQDAVDMTFYYTLNSNENNIYFRIKNYSGFDICQYTITYWKAT